MKSDQTSLEGWDQYADPCLRSISNGLLTHQTGWWQAQDSWQVLDCWRWFGSSGMDPTCRIKGGPKFGAREPHASKYLSYRSICKKPVHCQRPSLSSCVCIIGIRLIDATLVNDEVHKNEQVEAQQEPRLPELRCSRKWIDSQENASARHSWRIKGSLSFDNSVTAIIPPAWLWQRFWHQTLMRVSIWH